MFGKPPKGAARHFCSRILCEALAVALGTRDKKVVQVVTTADDCITAVASYQPDACVMDVHLPGPADGLRAVREIRARYPSTSVLVVSDLSDPVIRATVRQLGVAGLLCKDRTVRQIDEALRLVENGEPVPGGPVVPQEVPGNSVPIGFTPREREVLRRIVAGQDTRQMAGEMSIAISTLRTYVKNVLAKLGAHSRLEAAAVATRLNLPGEISAGWPLPSRNQGEFSSSSRRPASRHRSTTRYRATGKSPTGGSQRTVFRSPRRARRRSFRCRSSRT